MYTVRGAIFSLFLLCLFHVEAQEEAASLCCNPGVEEFACGVDGITYQICVALCGSNIEIACFGECPCECQEELAPVCGSNNVTYLNKARAIEAGVSVACMNSCPCINTSPLTVVCSSPPPCTNPNCPAFPNATCVASGPFSCDEVYISGECEIVDCDT